MDNLRPIWAGGENNRHLIRLASLKELGGFFLRVKGPQRLNRDLFSAIEANISKHELISSPVYLTVTNHIWQFAMCQPETNQPTKLF
jgi:hypothetical protein